MKVVDRISGMMMRLSRMDSDETPGYAAPMKKSLFALFLLTLPCSATVTNTSLDSSCPVRITKAYFLGGSGVEHTLYVSYFNQSQKVVIGVKFGFSLLDAVGDLHPYTSDLADSRKTKIGKNSYNSTFPIYADPDAGMRIHLKKLAFDDGTTWEDDGSMKCQYFEDSRRR